MKNSLRLRRLSSFVVLVAALLVLTRCGQQGALPPSGTFGNVYQGTFKTACIGCHAPGLQGPANGVNFDVTTQAKAYQTLVGPPTVRVSGFAGAGTCGTVQLVFGGQPTRSYLAAVLFASFNVNNFAGVGGCQPINTHHSFLNISATEKTSIVNWITNGAKND